MMQPVNVNRKLPIYSNLRLTIQRVFIYVEIWNLYFENTEDIVCIIFVQDPLWRIVNPNFVMIQQKMLQFRKIPHIYMEYCIYISIIWSSGVDPQAFHEKTEMIHVGGVLHIMAPVELLFPCGGCVFECICSCFLIICN